MGVHFSHTFWSLSPRAQQQQGSWHSPCCAGLISNSSNFLPVLSEHFMVSSDILGGLDPDGWWPHAETPGYPMAKPEMSCDPAHASWCCRLLIAPSYLSGTAWRESTCLWGVPIPCEEGSSTDGNLDLFIRKHSTKTRSYLYLMRVLHLNSRPK